MLMDDQAVAEQSVDGIFAVFETIAVQRVFVFVVFRTGAAEVMRHIVGIGAAAFVVFAAVAFVRIVVFVGAVLVVSHFLLLQKKLKPVVHNRLQYIY